MNKIVLLSKILMILSLFWVESPEQLGFYRDKDGYDYQILMATSETLEKDWNKIAEFGVIVTKYSDPI